MVKSGSAGCGSANGYSFSLRITNVCVHTIQYDTIVGDTFTLAGAIENHYKYQRSVLAAM